MPEPIAEVVERVRRHYADGCFACGRENPIGLRLDGFTLSDDGWVSAAFSPRDDYRGARDSLHGGIAATAIDEILVWAGVLTERVVCVTGTLDLRYRRPLTVSDRIVARARVDERRGRRLRIGGHLETGGKPAVEGSGLYLVNESVDDL